MPLAFLQNSFSLNAGLDETSAKRMKVCIGVTSSAGAISKIQTKCIEGGRSP